MCERSNDSTSLPEVSGPFDEQFVYSLTDEGERLLAERGLSSGKAAGGEVQFPWAVAEAVDAEAWRERKRRRRENARERGVRFGTVCGRWRNGRRLPDLRMTGRWLEEAGFELGREYEVRGGGWEAYDSVRLI